MKTRQFFLLFLIPAVIAIIAWRLNDVRGCYYYHQNSDPAYLYLINSLNIATLQPVNHVDNPGTTVQVLGGAVVKVMSLFRGVKDVEKDVLLNPELYLNAINRVMLAINIAAIIMLGVVAYLLTKSIWLSLLLQCAVFASWLGIKALTMVSPEPMSVFVSILFVLLIVWVAEKNIEEKKPMLATLLFAVVTSFGLATKLTFIPFIVMPLFILPGLKWRTIYLFATAIVFHIFLIPAYAHYDFLLRWVKILLLNTQQYGQGTPDIIDFGGATLNLAKLIILEHPLFIALAFSIVLLLIIYLNTNLRKELRGNSSVKALQGVTVSVVFNTLLVAKSYNPRYLLPSLMLLTAIIYLNIRVYHLVNAIRPIEIRKSLLLKALIVVFATVMLFIRHYSNYTPGDTYADWMQSVSRSGSFTSWITETFLVDAYLLLAFVILFVLVLSIMIYRFKMQREKLNAALVILLVGITAAYQLRHIDIPGFYRNCEKASREAKSVINFVENRCSDSIKIYGERSSSKYYALKYGTSHNFTRKSQLERMKELYPDEKIYFWGLNIGEREFESWTGKVSLADIMKQDGQVILQSDTGNLTSGNIQKIESYNKVRLANVFSGDDQVVYSVTRF